MPTVPPFTSSTPTVNVSAWSRRGVSPPISTGMPTPLLLPTPFRRSTASISGVADVEPTVRFLTDIFGYQTLKSFQSDAEFEGESVVLTLGEGIGKELSVTYRSDPHPGFRGIGSIHHVALTVPPAESISDWHEKLVATGLKVTDVIRRYYFDSVYVRIPGGTLFELATAGPGLAIDEDVDYIGRTSDPAAISRKPARCH